MIEDRPLVDMVSKSWGFEKRIINNDKYCGKLLYVVKNKHTSLHYHKSKDETFYVHAGKAKVYYTDNLKQAKTCVDNAILNPADGSLSIPIHQLESVTLNVGDAFRVPAGRVHRIYAVEDIQLYEFSTTHDEGDTVRLA